MRQSGIVRNSVYLTAAGGTERAASLVVTLMLSRSGGASDLGAYVTVIAYLQLLTVAAELGVSNYLVREMARTPEQAERWISHAVILATAASVVLSLGMLAAVPHLGFSRDVRVGLTVAAVAVLPAALNVVSRAVFVANQRVIHDAGANVVASIALVVSGWWLLAHGAGVVALVAAYVATRVLITVYSFTVIHLTLTPLRMTFDRAFARRMARGLAPFTASSVVGALFARPEVLIISLLSSSRQVGMFGAAFKTVDLSALVPETYMLNAYPLLSRAHDDDPALAVDLQRRATTGLLMVGLPISVGLAVAAEPAIRLLYGPDFGGAVLPLRLMAALAALFCIHTVLWRSLSARGQQGTVVRIQVVTLGVRLVVGVVLIASFGAVGAALTIPLCLGLHNVVLSRALPGGASSVFDPRALWPSLVATGLMGAVTWASGVTSLLGLGLLGASVYGLALAVLLPRAGFRARPPAPVPVTGREPR